MAILSENEENYFALAERFVDGSAWPQETAVFDASPHRMLSDGTLGALVSAIGYEPAQVVTRSLTVAAYALVLPTLFSVFRLTALDAALAVMMMALIGEDIIGGEWMFSGYEAKVAAYVIVLAALRLVLVSERLAMATLLFAAATYVHFLVGGFWFIAAMALRLLDRPRELRRVGAATALFLLLVAPLVGMIAWSRIADTTAARDRRAAARRDLFDHPRAASPVAVYLLGVFPRHLAARLSHGRGDAAGLPRGRLARCNAPAARAGGVARRTFGIPFPRAWAEISRSGQRRARKVLSVPAFVADLVAMVAAGACSRGGGIRAVGVDAARRTSGDDRSGFLYIVGGRLTREIAANETLEAQRRLLVAAVTRATAPGDIVLIDPDVETQLVDFERRTGRPTL